MFGGRRGRRRSGGFGLGALLLPVLFRGVAWVFRTLWRGLKALVELVFTLRVSVAWLVAVWLGFRLGSVVGSVLLVALVAGFVGGYFFEWGHPFAFVWGDKGRVDAWLRLRRVREAVVASFERVVQVRVSDVSELPFGISENGFTRVGGLLGSFKSFEDVLAWLGGVEFVGLFGDGWFELVGEDLVFRDVSGLPVEVVEGMGVLTGVLGDRVVPGLLYDVGLDNVVNGVFTVGGSVLFRDKRVPYWVSPRDVLVAVEGGVGGVGGVFFVESVGGGLRLVNSLGVGVLEGVEFLRRAGVLKVDEFFDVVLRGFGNERVGGVVVEFPSGLPRGRSVDDLVRVFKNFRGEFGEGQDVFVEGLSGGDGVVFLSRYPVELGAGVELLRRAGVLKMDDFMDARLVRVSGGLELRMGALPGKSVGFVVDGVRGVSSVFGSGVAVEGEVVGGDWVIRVFTGLSAGVVEANELLESAGVLSGGEFVRGAVLRSGSDFDELRVPRLRGWDVNVVGDRLRGVMSGFDFGAPVRSLLVVPVDSGEWVYRFVKRDRLDDVWSLDVLPGFEPGKMEVACAVDSFGDEVWLGFRGFAGMLISGAPGSGKTAGVTTFLLPLAVSSDVELSVVNMKGDTAFEAYEPLCESYYPTVEDSGGISLVSGDDEYEYESVFKIVEEFVEEYNVRVRTVKERLGVSNFWDASLGARRGAGFPFKLLVIDEAHMLFEKGGLGKFGKERQGAVEKGITQLIKLGRSVGIFVILITQKPTSDAIPTAIKGVTGLRVAFRLEDAFSEEAAFGKVDPFVRAIDIPSARKGGAVFADVDSNTFRMVRFYYVPEGDQFRLLSGGKRRLGS